MEKMEWRQGKNILTIKKIGTFSLRFCVLASSFREKFGGLNLISSPLKLCFGEGRERVPKKGERLTIQR